MFQQPPFTTSPVAVPLTPPSKTVEEDEQIPMCLPKQWIPYIATAMNLFQQAAAWKGDDATKLNAIEQCNELIDRIVNGMGDICSDGCREYSPAVSVIDYAPQNPYTEAGVVPSGYINPAWHLVDSSDVASHIGLVQIGDVITGWLSLPVFTPALGVGLARFRVHVRGSGRCDLHLVQIPNGGAVVVTQDDNPFTVRTFELDRDLVSLPPETADVIIVESTFDTDGDHHVDVTFFPRFNDSPIFVGYGGGVRKIVLCGQLEPAYPNPTQVPTVIDEMEYQMAICEQLRFQNGKLQGLCCGQWEDISGQDGINLSNAPQQGDGAPQALPGNCQAYHAVFDAKSQYLVPAVVSSGDTISFANVKGAGQDGGVSPWHCPDGLTFFAGACVGVAGSASTGDPDMSAPHMSLVVQIGGTWYRATGSITVPGGVSNSQIIIQANDSTLTDNSGSYALDVTVCNNQTAMLTWSHTFDFTINPYSSVWALSGQVGVWTPGVGYQDTFYTDGVHATRGVDLFLTGHIGLALTDVKIYNTTVAGGTIGNPLAEVLNSSATLAVTISGTPPPAIWDMGAYTNNGTVIIIRPGQGSGAGDPGGTCIISKIVLTGTGVDPF